MKILGHLAVLALLSFFVFFLFVFCVAFSEREKKPTSQLILNPDNTSVSMK